MISIWVLGIITVEIEGPDSNGPSENGIGFLKILYSGKELVGVVVGQLQKHHLVQTAQI
jgi:hypothetical protein